MSTKYVVKNIFAVFSSLLDSQLSNSIDLKKQFSFFSSTDDEKAWSRQREPPVMQNDQMKIKMRY